jgi:DNA gyrase subunit A
MLNLIHKYYYDSVSFQNCWNLKKKILNDNSSFKKPCRIIIFQKYNSNKELKMISESFNRGKVISTDLHTEMSTSYMEYAMSVIYGRALPDVRDGLKPVHRRILYAMYDLGLYPNTPFRKCARVVGEVLGKYHPHGDSAVYEAMVRMAQTFSMRSVLIFGHGNFGSIDHDPPAAMRYTECKISNITQDLILKDIEKQSSDFINNFDGSCKEPSVLPSVLPTLLLNGSSGIAVGMATNIPPHNLSELANITIQLIKNPQTNQRELMKIIPGPDFPTGGTIVGLQGCQNLYESGQGSLVLRGNSNFETIRTKGKTTRDVIIITEVPYQVNKVALITKIAEMVNDKTLEGIQDLRDESDRDGVRIVIELKKDVNKKVILNNLFKKTPLQITFGGLMLALVGRQPVILSLKELMLLFIHFRKQTIRRKLQFYLNNSIDRIYSIRSLILTLNDIDFVLVVIRRSKNNQEARVTLMESGLTQDQSDSILNVQLRRLTRFETDKLNNEYTSLSNSILDLKEGVVNRERIGKIMKKEIQEIKSKYGMPRRTNIIFSENSGFIKEAEMVENFQSIVMVTRYFIKRMIIETFEAQKRGTRGKKGVVIQENDEISHFFSCSNLDTILAISYNGIAFSVMTYRIPISRRNSRGVSLSTILPTVKAGGIASIIPIPAFSSKQFLILLTQEGMIKKTPLQAFKNVSARGLIVLKLKSKDQLKWVRRCYSVDTVMISTQNGKALRFLTNTYQLRSTGRTSKGVRSISLGVNDKIADMDIIPYSESEKDFKILLITSKGYGKRVVIKHFKIQNRGGKGIIIVKLRQNEKDNLISSRFCKEDEEVLLSSKEGTILRQKAKAIAVQSRFGKGVKVQKLSQYDTVSKVSILPPELIDFS